jgi:hypothetical protein
MDENKTKATIIVVILLVVIALLIASSSIMKRFSTITFQKAYIVSKMGTNPGSNQPKVTDKKNDVMLYAVLEVKKRFSSKPYYFANVPEITIDGTRIPADQLSKWDDRKLGPVSVNWYKIEPILPMEKGQTLKLQGIAYQESLSKDWGSVWEHKADVSPMNYAYSVTYPEYPTDVGTMRYKISIEKAASGSNAAQKVSSPGVEAKDDIGLTDAVHRVTVRGDDTFIGNLMGLFHVPFTTESLNSSFLTKSMERFLGGESASFLMGSYLLKGYKNLDYTQKSLLEHANVILERAVQDNDGVIVKEEETRGRFGKKVTKTNLTVGSDVRPGDIFTNESGVMAVFFKQAKREEATEALKNDDLVLIAYNFTPVIDKISNVFEGDFSIRRLTE